jgi:hypothetical protein
LPGQAADLSKIPLRIGKEPAYQTTKPRYCLLVFGPEAKTRVWLVEDGDVLYADRNGNGDLTDPEERFRFDKYPPCRIGDVHDPASGTTYKSVEVVEDSQGRRVSVVIPGRGRQVAHSDRFGSFEFGASAAQAPVVHFGGPLELSLQSLDSPARDPHGVYLPVVAVVGTPGKGKGTFAVINPDDEFRGAKFVCEPSFTPKCPDATPAKVFYNYSCY